MPLCTKTGEVKFVMKARFISYPAGVYDSGTKYTCTEMAGPFVECNGQFYSMSRVGTWLGTNEGRTPQQDYAQYGKSAMWQLMDKYKAIITEMLFADYAKLGSAVFLDDYMFSQYGVNASGASTNAYQNFNPATLGQSECKFTPNLYIDWYRGYIEALTGTFKGSIHAKRLYTEFTYITDLPVIWNPDVHSCNISVRGTSGKTNLVTLVLPQYAVGLTLRFYCEFRSRSDVYVYIGLPSGSYFITESGSYSYYRLPANSVTELTSVKMENGVYRWVIHNPNGAFLNELP